MTSRAVKKAISEEVVIKVPSLHLDVLIPIAVDDVISEYDSYYAHKRNLDPSDPDELHEIRESHPYTRAELTENGMATVVDYIMRHSGFEGPSNMEAKRILLFRYANAIKRHFLIPPEIVDQQIGGGFRRPPPKELSDGRPEDCPEVGQVRVHTQDSSAMAIRLQMALF